MDTFVKTLIGLVIFWVVMFGIEAIILKPNHIDISVEQLALWVLVAEWVRKEVE